MQLQIFFRAVLLALLVKYSNAVYNGWYAHRVRDRELIKSFVHFHDVPCGGVLITWNHVLTAAHCPIRVGDVAYLGSADFQSVNHNGIAYRVAISAGHSGYAPHTRNLISDLTMSGDLVNDIRLITLEGASQSEMAARGIAPAPIDWNTHKWYPGRTAKLRVAGFGATTVKCAGNHHRLKRGNAYTTKCHKYPKYFGGADYYRQICLDGTKGGQTICRGDSGGPVLYKQGKHWVVVGLVSGGEQHGGKSCVPRERWHITNIAGFRNWIIAKMQALP